MASAHGPGTSCMSADPGRRFVDSNVLIYAHDRTAGEKYERARGLVDELWGSRTGVVSVQVLQEFFVNVNTKIGTAEARRLVSDYGNWRMHAPQAIDVIEAIDIHREYKIS